MKTKSKRRATRKPYADSWSRQHNEPTAGEFYISQIAPDEGKAYVNAKREYPKSCCVAEVRAETIMRDELLANAALFMGAKDLLAACRLAINTLNGLSPGYIGLDADGHYRYDSDAIDRIETALSAAILKATITGEQP